MRTVAPPLAVFCLSFGLYLATTCQHVYIGDAAEFVTNAVTLGINHPTGYPLYTILSRFVVMAFSFLTPALALNAFSALTSAMAVTVFFFVLRELGCATVVAVPSSLLYAVSATFWSRSTSAEVYSLSMVFTIATLVLVLVWQRDRDVRYLLLAAYACGVGASQHATNVLFVLWVVLYVLWDDPSLLRKRNIILAVIGFAMAGATIYLYLPFRSMANPPVDWSDPERWSGLANHLFPAAGKDVFTDVKNVREHERWIIAQLVGKEYWWFGCAVLVGLVPPRSHWRLWLCLLAAAAVDIAYGVSRKVPSYADMDALYITAFLVQGIFIAMGLHRIVAAFASTFPFVRRTPARLTLGAVLCLAPATVAFVMWPEQNRRDVAIAEDLKTNLFAHIEPNAVLITTGDEQMFLSLYAQYVDHHRSDIAIVNTSFLGSDWGLRLYADRFGIPLPVNLSRNDALHAIVRSQISVRPVYNAGNLPDVFKMQEWDFVPRGLVQKLQPKDSASAYVASDLTVAEHWPHQIVEERASILLEEFQKQLARNALFWFQRGRYEEALSEVRQLRTLQESKDLLLQEDRRTAFLLEGMAAFELRRTEQALHAANEAVSIGDDPRTYVLRGRILVSQDKLREAEADWKHALVLSPRNDVLRQDLEGLRDRIAKRSMDPR